jgi:3-methyladenine DNA glycosylase AlkD
MEYLYLMEEIRKIIRETLEELSREQRYVATMEFYVWAESDEEAKVEANRMAEEMQIKYDNQASIKELGNQPYGTMNYTKIDL